jgi:hypothetical protein
MSKENEYENEREIQSMRQGTRCEYRAVIYCCGGLEQHDDFGDSSKTIISTGKLSSEHI